MPVANIIEIQETVLNSGFSPSLPSGMRPKFFEASTITKTANTEAAMTNSQPVLVITQSSALPATAPRPSGETNPQAMNARARQPAMPNTQ